VLHSGKIYDVTDFADRHPGGREIIENRVGQDVTQVMKSLEIHRHSPAAFKILDRYYIGDYNTSNGVVSIIFLHKIIDFIIREIM
jgi:4-hydroxysphinganine ceramide fatty acyl 2-hydroxylase